MISLILHHPYQILLILRHLLRISPTDMCLIKPPSVSRHRKSWYDASTILSLREWVQKGLLDLGHSLLPIYHELAHGLIGLVVLTHGVDVGVLCLQRGEVIFAERGVWEV